jgi:predicted hydrocarbon binding protein
MSDMTLELSSSSMVALTRDTLGALRSALMRDAGDVAAGILQEAGYVGGGSLFAAFGGWLTARGQGAPETLSVPAFQQQATDFFREAGWGSLSVGELHDTVATLDSPDWGESSPDAALPQPSCHLSAGMLADFFGRVADAPLAVMEVECRSAGAHRCRFLIGSTEVMQAVYDGMSQGAPYDAAVLAAG